MKYRIFSIITALLVTTSLFSQDVGLKNRIDSLSYAVGVSMHNGSKQFQLKLNYDLLVKGVLAADAEEAIFDVDEANSYIQKVEKQARDTEAKLISTQGYEFLKENMKQEGIVVTQSGLQYMVIKQGDGPKPTATDKVKVHYVGYLLDGTKFDSSHDRGDAAVFNLSSIIVGWQEALKLMAVGSEYVIYCPPHLAYGDRAMGDDIKPGSTLMFEIQLLDIVTE
jgi:FKBP-type peptidyl-prolyl cis-trans isomerase